MVRWSDDTTLVELSYAHQNTHQIIIQYFTCTQNLVVHTCILYDIQHDGSTYIVLASNEYVNVTMELMVLVCEFKENIHNIFALVV